MVVVALDAMGGDNAPKEIVKGGLLALERNDEVYIKLVGKKEVIEKELEGVNYPKDRLEIVHATEIIETGDHPVESVRKKKDSSIVVAMKLVRHQEADAFVSAGSTGAVLVGGQIIVGRIKGVERAPLAPLLPTTSGVSLLIDCGANVDARSSHLVQFAKMGSIYMEKIVGIKKPRVAIVNVGLEEEKGNALVKETYPLLKACTDINFIGSIEAREIPRGGADVIVCEAFTGNVILKLYEGVGSTLIEKIKTALTSSWITKIGAAIIKPVLKKSLRSFDTSDHGGAPLLGLNGLVVKTHGNSTANEIANSVIQCIKFKEENIAKYIERALEVKAQ